MQSINIQELTRSAPRLEQILFRHGEYFEGYKRDIEAIAFRFSGDESFALEINIDTDEFIVSEIDTKRIWHDIAEIHPDLANACSLQLFWSWQMTNHQGYFDAFQIELGDASLKKRRILQFKVVASGITAWTVSEA